MRYKFHDTGKPIPEQSFPVWFVDESERIHCREKNSFFEVTDHNTSDYFRITNRIDSIHLEGIIGRTDRESAFLESNQVSNLTYFIDYNEGKNVYMTFDRISLYKLVSIFYDKPIRLVLKQVNVSRSIIKNSAFMIMPFKNKDLDTLYVDVIRPFLKSIGVDIYRADDFHDTDTIIDTIHRLIEESEFLIAETTMQNKNAFYEIGYASAIGKEIIMLQDFSTEQKLFFDRAHIRAVDYSHKDMEQLTFVLGETIKTIRSKYS